MTNNVVLIGRLTKDPEMRTTQSGTPCCSYTLAVNRRFKKEGQPEADFINCVAWNKSAEAMVNYLHKGSLIAVQGRIQTRNYENQQGQRVYVTEVVTEAFDFLEPKSSSQGQSQSYGGSRANTPPAYGQPPAGGYASQPANYSRQDTFRDTYGGQAANPYAEPELDISTDDLPF